MSLKLNLFTSSIKSLTLILLALSFLVSPVCGYESLEDKNLQNYMLENYIEDYNIIVSDSLKSDTLQIFENDIGYMIQIRIFSFNDNTKDYLLDFIEDYYGIHCDDDRYMEYTKISGLGDKCYKVKFYLTADIDWYTKNLIFSKENLIIMISDNSHDNKLDYTELFVFGNLQLDVIDSNIKSDLQSNVDTKTVSITMTPPKQCTPYAEKVIDNAIYRCNAEGSGYTDLVKTCPEDTIPKLNTETNHFECEELTPTTPCNETIPGLKIFSVMFLICLVDIFIRNKE